MTNAATSAKDLNDYPFMNSRAARMLSDAFKRAEVERGMSQRQIAKNLNYRNSVTLSHMAVGRVPVPIDRAPDLARVLKMDLADFMLSVLEQRHPEIDWPRTLAPIAKGAVTRKAAPQSLVVQELEGIARKDLDDLPVTQINILREVVADPDPARRWLNIGEVPIIAQLRKSRPHGLTPADTATVTDCIEKGLE